LWLVNAERLTALWASPFFFLASDELPDAEFSDVLKIFDHAHAVLGSIPLIQIFKPGIREAVTTIAVLHFRIQFLAVLDPAHYASFRLGIVIASTAVARLPLSCICEAEAAVHAAGSPVASERNPQPLTREQCNAARRSWLVLQIRKQAISDWINYNQLRSP